MNKKEEKKKEIKIFFFNNTLKMNYKQLKSSTEKGHNFIKMPQIFNRFF